ncbi:MAG: choice-of-anchor D domain-containing protein [Flavobacteriaceae bacterium]|nr:choice-of-anchor D domain-containing protein [Flavobacteriaceae bacterium]
MRVVLLLLPFFVFSQNTLSGGSLNVNENTSFEYEIGIDNDSSVSALQFDIGINQDAFSYGSNHALTTRTSGFTVSSSNPSENIMRVVMYSSSGGVIEVGSGPTILKLDISSKTLPNDYTFSISNVVLSDATGTELSSSSSNGTVSVRGAHLNVNTTTIDFGRVPIGDNEQRLISISNSGNENLTVSEVSLSSPISLTSTLPLTISPGGSQSVSIALDSSEKYDASSEVSFTTNDNDGLRQLQKTTVSAIVFAMNEIHIGSGSGAIHTDIRIPVSINNMEPFSGFQFDLTLPQDINYVENSVALSTRKSDHSVSGSLINANTLRVIAYSNTNAEFSESDGEVMTLKLKPEVSSGNYNLTISNPIISNITLGDIESDSYNGSVQINAPNLVTNPSSISFGRVPITETKQQVIRLTNNGSAELNISSIVKDVSLFDIDTETPFTISQGAYKDIELTFTPSSNGNVDQDISIRHNGSTEQNIINVTADVFSPNYLSIDDIEVLNGESYNLLFRLHNYNSVKGVQVDIDFPQGFSFDFSNMVMSSSTTNFSISSSSLSNGNRRIIIYNTSGESIGAGSEVLFELPFSVNNDTSYNDYTLAYSNVVISDQNNQDVSSETLTSGKISVVQSLSVKDFADSIQVYPNPFSDKVIISSESLVDVSVYNILGSEVLKENSVNELNTTNLKPGIYIFKIHSKDLEINLKMIK